MAIILLHLSDIHISGASDPILKLASEIGATVHSQDGVIDDACILVTGDIAFSGLKNQYDLAEGFLKRIQSRIERELGKKPMVVLVPGNHDCNFENEDPIRNTLIEALTGSKPSPTSDKIINECTAVQAHYFDFEGAFPISGDSSGDKLWHTNVVQLGGSPIAFERFNLSWLSKIKEQPGKIYFPVERYDARVNPPAAARIVMMHHPLNWISQSAYRPFRQFVRKLGDFVLTGHEHHIATGSIDDSETEKSHFVEGGVLQSESKDIRDSCFSVLSIDLKTSEFRSVMYNWNGSHFAKGSDSPWAKLRSFAPKTNAAFSLTREFAETLDDPGPFFGPAEERRIKLEDLFVYPTLLKKGPAEAAARINASELSDPSLTKGGVLLEGEEKTGRTSLLHRVYRSYFDKGIIPVLIGGHDIRKDTAASLDEVIAKAVADQYGDERVEPFKQLPKSDKILLIDNLDDCKLKAPKKVAFCLNYLMAKVDHAVFTVGGLFELRSLLDQSTSSGVNSMRHYKIDEFGYVLRGRLVDRWLGATFGGALSPEERLAKRDHIEKTMNHTMVRKIVPSVPIYVLILLENIDAERGSDLKDSALGYYYQSLISDTLRKAGVAPDKQRWFRFFGHGCKWIAAGAI